MNWTRDKVYWTGENGATVEREVCGDSKRFAIFIGKKRIGVNGRSWRDLMGWAQMVDSMVPTMEVIDD